MTDVRSYPFDLIRCTAHQFVCAIVWTTRTTPIFEIHAGLTRRARARIRTLSATAVLTRAFIFASILAGFVIAAIVFCHPILREEKIGVWI